MVQPGSDRIPRVDEGMEAMIRSKGDTPANNAAECDDAEQTELQAHLVSVCWPLE